MTTQLSSLPDTHRFDPSILREYDVRGTVGKTLNEQDALALGAAFASFVIKAGGKTICVGYDGRHSSPSLTDAFIQGARLCGADVTKLGCGPTPMVYFAVKDRLFDAGVMVTGSHNPPEYNGFKMTLLKKGVFGEDIQTLGKIAQDGQFNIAQTQGELNSLDVREDYVARLLRDLKWPEGKELRVAWDAGNGATGDILKMMVKQLPGEHILLFEDIDGDFPNHHPDPTVDKNLKDLQAAVAKHKCDIGIAFDGDGDRIGVVDENGGILRSDRLLTLYAGEILKRKPGAPIIADVKCSHILFETIAKLGGQPVMWKTGHSLVKSKMAELSAPLAGELSGHIFFADGYYGFDDGLYCALRLLNILGEGDQPFSALLNDLPETISTPEIRLDVPEETKFDIPEKIRANVQSYKETLSEEEQKNYQINDIDGIRLTTEDGWWLLRASNTQNCLVIRLEAETQEGMERLQNSLRSFLETQGLDFIA